jgi:hypothetical protein
MEVLQAVPDFGMHGCSTCLLCSILLSISQSTHDAVKVYKPCTYSVAGMMAIPRAFLQIGSVLGTAMLIGVALLIYFTLVVLVHGSAVTGAGTYSQLTFVTCGKPVMKLLQVAVLAFCFGFGVIYLVSWFWRVFAARYS